MRLTFTRGAAWIVARMSGELDLSSAAGFRERVDLELRRAGVPNLILSLRGLEFVDSTGLGSLLGRHRQVTSSGGRLILTDIPPKVMSMIEMAGLASVLSIARTQEEALRLLESNQHGLPGGASQ
jgi:stage II sporulation protein AA (anti-sigma F factor antagonist)